MPRPRASADPDGGGIVANDVGENGIEEIDDIAAGGNFGWPTDEGKASGPKYRDPLYQYGHNDGCAIMGGEYYRPLHPSFPADYLGKYFFADFCIGTLRVFDPASASASPSGKAVALSVQAAFPTGLRIAPDGAVYFLSRGYDTGPVRVEIRGIQGNLEATLADLPGLNGALDLEWGPRPVRPRPGSPPVRVRERMQGWCPRNRIWPGWNRALPWNPCPAPITPPWKPGTPASFPTAYRWRPAARYAERSA